MRDSFKDFIENNRKDFDDLIPRDQWTEIHKSIRQSAGASSTFKTISNMFKYGFSASALIIGTFMVINTLQKTPAPEPDIKQQVLPSQPPEVPLEPEKEIITQNKVSIPDRKPELLSNPVSKEEQPAEDEIRLPSQTISYNNPLPANESVINKQKLSLIKEQNDDSLQSAGRNQIDTIFKGVKSIVVQGVFCDVSVKGSNREDVFMKGNISPEAGSTIVLGRRIIKNSEFKIKYERNGSELKVWMEEENLDHTVQIKRDKKEHSFLHFEVPEKCSVVVKNKSGNIQVSDISSPKMLLETTFGEVNVETIHSELTVNVSSGDISLKKITGDLKTSSSFGSQVLSNIKGSVNLRSSSGNITVNNVTGDCDVKSSFGFQKYDTIKGNISSVASSGNVIIKNHKGNAQVKTTFGKQHYENTEGNIVSSASSGDVYINGSTGSLVLKTSFGNIKGENVRLSESSEFKTSSGNISMELLNPSKDLRFDLQASSGNLDINKNNLKNHSTKSLSAGEGSILVRGISSFGNQSYH